MPPELIATIAFAVVTELVFGGATLYLRYADRTAPKGASPAPTHVVELATPREPLNTRSQSPALKLAA